MGNFLSGRRDLNSGPPAPKAGALAELRYAPIFEKKDIVFNTKNQVIFEPQQSEAKLLSLFSMPGLDG